MNIDDLIETLEQKITELTNQKQSLDDSPSRSDLTTSQQIDHLKLNFKHLQNDCSFVSGDLVMLNPYDNIYNYPVGAPFIVARTYPISFEVIEGHAMLPHDMIIGVVQNDGHVVYYKVHSRYFIPFKQEQ